MRTILLFILCCFICICSYSQTILVGGKPSTGKLTWDDFTGRVDRSSSFNGFTSYVYNTKWNKVSFVGESAVIEGIDVVLELDAKNSWAKKDKVTDDLLVHEQGHFNIGILHAREVLKSLKDASFTRTNLNSGMQRISTETGKKYSEMTIRYDKETDHSKNKEQQAKWNKFFEEQLAIK